MATIVVGIEDSFRGQDAVALAGDLARTTGGELLAVCAYPFDDRPESDFNPVMRAPMREAAEHVLERVCEPLASLPHVRELAVADPSPARALLNVATAVDAALIVVGSSHSGYHGVVQPGSTGRRLLAGAPCAVALAPQGYRVRAPLRGGRVSVGYDGSSPARAALRAGARLAHAAGLALHVVRVFAPDPVPPLRLHVPPGYPRLTDRAERDARAELERAAGVVLDAEPVFLTGDPAAELATVSASSELLVIGSRAYGPTPAVLLGEVSGALVQTASCPVVVVPNGVMQPLSGLVRVHGKLLSETAA